MEYVNNDAILSFSAGVSVGGAAIAVASFFAAFNPIFIGLASILSITVAIYTLYHKRKHVRHYKGKSGGEEL